MVQKFGFSFEIAMSCLFSIPCDPDMCLGRGTPPLWARAIPESKWGRNFQAHWAPFHHLPAVLAKWEIPCDWTMANVTLFYMKTWKENLGNYRSVTLTSVLGKVTEQIIWTAIT